MTADVEVIQEASISLFLLLTEQARGWVEEHVVGERQFLGLGLAVEHRYVANLVCGLQRDGLVVAVRR